MLYEKKDIRNNKTDIKKKKKRKKSDKKREKKVNAAYNIFSDSQSQVSINAVTFYWVT